MKKLMVIVGCAATALAGCVTRQAVVEEVCNGRLPGITRLDAKHARLKSILGINDAALADTNRFVLGAGNYSQVFRLDKSFGGFVDARVYLDRMEYPRLRTDDGKPHRLRSVELKRRLPDGVSDKDLASEWQAACDLVADILDVEPPKVRLVDVEKWRKGPECLLRGFGHIRSCVTFDLADDQDIDVRLTEPVYVMRNGKAVMACPGYVEIDLMYNRSLCLGGIGKPKARGEEKVEKEIAFGPDCRDKLAKALKDGIERRAKRKAAKDGENKAK